MKQLILQFSPRLLQSIFSSSSKDISLRPAGSLLKNGYLNVQDGSSLYAQIQEIIRISPRKRLDTSDVEEILSGYPEKNEIRLYAATCTLLNTLVQTGYLSIAESIVSINSLSSMQSLLNRMITSPEEKLSMEDAAALVNLSYSNFCRTFKQTVGMSYVDFNNMIRIQRAQELLLNTTMSVTEISAQLNFGSVSYFNRIFKSKCGCTPLSYRGSR